MSPKAKNFNAGSIIYFEGDKADSVFLLKEGRVNLIYDDLATKEKITDQINQGEFFGVKSGLTRLPREETAKVVASSIVFEFSALEFESLIMKNTSIILKMLKVFSTQLRKVGKQIQSLVSTNVTDDQADEFFQIGEYYLKSKKYKQASTVYKRYLNYYPSGKYASLAAKRLETANNSLNSYGDGGGPAPTMDDFEEGGSSLNDLSNSTNIEETQESSSNFSEFSSDINNDDSFENDFKSDFNEDNFEADFDDTSDDDGFDDISSFDSENINLDNTSSDEGKLYYKGISFMSQNKYLDAFNTFKKVLEKNNQQLNILASFEIGKCFFFLNKYNECINHLSQFITKHPSFREKNEVLFYLGKSYSKVNEKVKAVKLYTNLISNTDENDQLNRKAKKALKELK